MRSGVRLGFVAAVMVSMLSAPALATTIFSSLDAGNTYDGGTGWTITGTSAQVSAQTVASGFVSSGNFSLEQIDVGLSSILGTNSAVVSLWTESGGLPGSQLGSWSVSNQPSFGSSNNTLTTISGISGINLLSGGAYFLVVAPGAGNTWDAWNQTGTSGSVLFSTDSGATWSPSTDRLGAFDIIGSSSNGAVPEPMTLALLGAGLAGTAAMRRRKK